MAASAGILVEEEGFFFDLQPGDLLLKKIYTKDPVGYIIGLGQMVTQGSRHANYVHAAIAVGKDQIVEAQKEGMVLKQLDENKDFKYKVFRYKDPDLAQEVAKWAQGQIGVKYAFGEAFSSILATEKEEKETKERKPKREDEVPLTTEDTEKKETKYMGKPEPKQLFCSQAPVMGYNQVSYKRGQPALIPIDPEKANPSKLYGYLKKSGGWEMVAKLKWKKLDS